MCSIIGFIKNNNSLTLDEIEKFSKIMSISLFRGRTSFGGGFFINGQYDKCFKNLDMKSFVDNVTTYLKKIPEVSIGLCNMRAEPTTEWIKDKTIEDTQPFEFNRLIAVHNGLIANDSDFNKTHSIDSSLFGPLLDSVDDIEIYKDRLQTLKGSYSLLSYQEGSKNVYAAVNYKPLFLMKKEGIIYFASLREYFDEDKYNSKYEIIEVDPYTLLQIDVGTLEIKTTRLYTKKFLNNKAVIICSGGLDSTVVAQYAKEIDNMDIILLHFIYGCMAEKKEIQSIKDIAKSLGVAYKFINIDFFKDDIGGSSLFSEDESKIKKMDLGVEYAYEWVPARNLVLLSIATAFAESKGIDNIYLGTNLEESGAYPDNEHWFIDLMNRTIKLAVQNDTRLMIHTPVGNLMKYEIVKMGIDLNAPIDKTWSCYKKGNVHCGICGPCRLRKVAFQMNNKQDLIKYEND